jgi:hypothetical protein
MRLAENAGLFSWLLERNVLVPFAMEHGLIDFRQVVILLELLDRQLGHPVCGCPALVRIQVVPPN